MPGKSYHGPLLPITKEEKGKMDELRMDVEKLAGEIGERNVWRYRNLISCADFLEESLTKAGYKVNRQEYEASGKNCRNIEAEIKGTDKAHEIIIIGAHYDTVEGSPGANDNASGVAALLAIARAFARVKTSRTVRFVFFTNEEPPFFTTGEMGSLVYAKECRKHNDNVVAMLCLETIGYYTDEPGSQDYPFPLSYFYPTTGNFIGFVGNIASKKLVRRIVASFRKHTQFPSEAAALMDFITGISWSDQWSFWQQGYPAVMVTDTAFFRYSYYHTGADTPQNIKYDRLARVVNGLEKVIQDLAVIPSLSG
ncbi:Bacterial leucyl aminopeptidase [subsurface metagenome]